MVDRRSSIRRDGIAAAVLTRRRGAGSRSRHSDRCGLCGPSGRCGIRIAPKSAAGFARCCRIAVFALHHGPERFPQPWSCDEMFGRDVRSYQVRSGRHGSVGKTAALFDKDTPFRNRQSAETARRNGSWKSSPARRHPVAAAEQRCPTAQVLSVR